MNPSLKLGWQIGKSRALLVGATALLVVSCQYERSVEITTKNGNREERRILRKKGQEEYSFKTKDCSYEVQSNDRLSVKDGAVGELREGQSVELVVTESGREHRYRITKEATGITARGVGRLQAADHARIKWALDGVQRQQTKSPIPPKPTEPPLLELPEQPIRP
jgi:hypothetical protein